MDRNRKRKKRASSNEFDYYADNRALRNEIKMKHIRNQRKRQRNMRRNRGCLFSVLILIVIAVLLFFTPIFNIQHVTIEGNNKVSVEEIGNVTGELRGKNIFKTSIRNIKEQLSTIVYLDEINIQRKYFPPSLNIRVTESVGAAWVRIGEEYAVIDVEGKILERRSNFDDSYPLVYNYGDYEESNGYFILKDEEKKRVVTEMLTTFEDLEMTSNVDGINLEDLNNITFRYDDRIDAECGSYIDIDLKIRLFKSAVNANELSENARGTMDLSVSGRLIYSPDSDD